MMTLGRFCVVAALVGVAAGAWAGLAAAAQIDPGLQAELAARAAGERVDVLMLFQDNFDLEALDRGLAGATPEARRAAVIAALRARADAAQAQARRILDVQAGAGHVSDTQILWLVNGLRLRADAAGVAALAATKAAATLLHDKRYDMLGGARAAEAARVPTTYAAAAPTDTAWGVKWVKANRVWLDLGINGAGVLVGHFDTGVWLTHPDIANRLWVNPGEIAGNRVDDDGNGYVDDVHGYDFGSLDSDPNDDVTGTAANHGTHTAGTVAGDGTNGTATGVAPGASVMVCKVFDTTGGAAFSAIYEAHQYAMDMGARVFTQSLGLSGAVPVSLMMAERLDAEAIRVAGIAFFVSAGNEHLSYDPPLELGVTARVPAPWHAAAIPWSWRGGVITVGGTAYKSNATFVASSWGPAVWGDVPFWYDWPAPTGIVKPDVVAPGQGVNSLLKPDSYTGDTWSGTSMSCPHAAGVAALMLQQNPTLSPADIDSILESTALDLGAAGKDNTFGNGQIDALAAVGAVPQTLLPYVARTGTTTHDQNGDGFLDPGEAVEVVVRLANNSPVQDAFSVTAGLAVAPNPYVTVTDGFSNYFDLPAGGAAADNAADPYALIIAPEAPQGFLFTLRLTIAASGGYQVTEDFKFTVGWPEYRDHDAGAVHLTVTDQGIIGYMDDTQLFGNGLGWLAEASVLFVGSFWGGTDPAYVCNRDFSGVEENGTLVETYEWVTTTTPSGRVAVLAGGADQTYEAIFSDAGHPAPRSIQVTQRSYAWADAPYADFVLLRYTIRNNGAAEVANYHAGVFCDFDIGNSSANSGASDAGRGLAYMFEKAKETHAGVQLLHPSTARNLTFIDNPIYVYPEGMILDADKAAFLAGTLSLATTTTSADYSQLVSAGPFTIPAGGELNVAFALLMGENLNDLLANADAAQAMYAATPVEDLPPAARLLLAQNSPNPFNPRTEIRFTLAREGPVALDIFDPAGRKVRSLASGPLAPGAHAIAWDGTDEAGQRLPSGLYLYRLEADGRSLTRKMMLVK